MFYMQLTKNGEETNPPFSGITCDAVSYDTTNEVVTYWKQKQPNYEIWYFSTDGNTLSPYSTTAFGGVELISNTYANGKGIMRFSGEINEIGQNAFRDRDTLLVIMLPDSVKTIGESAFKDCRNTAAIVTPSGLTSIGDMAFNNCGSATTYTFYATTPPTLGGNVMSIFHGIKPSGTVCVPSAVINTYKSTDGWKELRDYMHPIE